MRLQDPLTAQSLKNRPKLITRPRVLLGLATLAYVITYILLFSTMGAGVGALSAIPVMLTGWLFGRRVGLLGALAFAVLNLSLRLVFEQPGAASLLRTLPGNLSLGFAGFITGWLHDLNTRLRHALTQQSQAEAALVASEKRFRVLIENSADAITLMSSDGTVIYDSPAAPRLLGYGPDELVGRNAFDLIHPDDLPQVQRALRQILEDPRSPVPSSFRFRHKDDTWRWLEAVASNLLAEPSVRAIAVNYRDITERKRAEDKIQRQFEYLTALRDIDRAIMGSLDLNLSLSLLLMQVTARLGVDAAAIFVYNQASQMLEQVSAHGFRRQAAVPARLRLGEGYAGRAALERRTLHIPDLREQSDNPPLTRALAADSFASYYAVPLIAKGQVRGVLEVFQRPPLDGSVASRPEREWLDFLETLADQAAIAVDNATLFAGLQRSNLELAVAYEATIEGWSQALDLRDKETEGHSQRVTEVTLQLARAMSMSEAELMHVRRGALLHDIGKLGVPDRILLKPEPLNEEEWVSMRQHPAFANALLSPIAFLRPALDIPYCHHERWDGAGYPRGLSGEQIPLAARLFAVVDVWDALRSDRPYRPAWPAERVLEHIRSLAGSHFDPRVVEAFLQLDS